MVLPITFAFVTALKKARSKVRDQALVKKINRAIGMKENFDGENDVEDVDSEDDPSLSISVRLIIVVMLLDLIFLIMSIYYAFSCYTETSTRVLLVLAILFVPFFSPIFVIYSVVVCDKKQLPPPPPAYTPPPVAPVV